MPKQLDFNPITGELDLTTIEGSIPEYTSDPSTPTPQTAWVLRSGSASGGGSPIGLLLTLTTPGTASYTYELKYRTLESTTVAVPLT